MKRLEDLKFIEKHYNKDMTAREISERLGIPRGTVISRAHKHVNGSNVGKNNRVATKK